jgi:sulfur carrier protein
MRAGDDAELSDEEERRHMKVTLNEEQIQVDEATTVAALLASMGYPDRGIAVAMDHAVLPRSGWSRTLSDGARLEVVTAVQGG